MYLGSLLKFVDKKHKRIPVKGICFDSRRVKKGDVFFAIEGKKTSGIKFIKEAIQRGASAVVTEKKSAINNYKIPFLLVKNVRGSLSEACSNFYKKKTI